MKFKVPISLRERRRYILVKVENPPEFRNALLSSIRELYGEVGLAYTPIKVYPIEGHAIIKTNHENVSRVLTAIYKISLTEGRIIEIKGVSGTINKIKAKIG